MGERGEGQFKKWIQKVRKVKHEKVRKVKTIEKGTRN